MTRKQIAFRIDQDKAQRLSNKAKEEGKMLNAVLESLVDRYLGEEVTTGNNESEDAAIALLTDKLNQLEKQLTPVSSELTIGNNKLTSVSTEVTTGNNESESEEDDYKGAIEALEEKIKKLVCQIEGKIDQHQLEERLAMATMPIWAELDFSPSETPLEQTETSSQDDSTPEETGWMQKQLMARLNCSKASINAWIKKGTLPEKTAQRDPDGIGWEKRGDLYYPIA